MEGESAWVLNGGASDDASQMYRALALLRLPGVSHVECCKVLKMLAALVSRIDNKIAPHATRTISTVSPLLLSETTRADAECVLKCVSQAVGLATVVVTTRSDFLHADQSVRSLAARSLCVMSMAHGSGCLTNLFLALKRSPGWWTRDSVALAIGHLSELLREEDALVVSNLIGVLAPLCGDEHEVVRQSAWEALGVLLMKHRPKWPENGVATLLRQKLR